MGHSIGKQVIGVLYECVGGFDLGDKASLLLKLSLIIIAFLSRI